ncbi:MAG TPA: DUF1295 domain-containing protein [Edaphocola sp.]|nr:DUF1295 domain-containing protein [Edaphocola sp.]
MNFEQYQFVAIIWIALAILIFILLLYVNAPYGRHAKTNWGPLINNRLGWFIMEFFLLIVLPYFLFTGSNHQSPVNLLIVGLLVFHYFYRSLVFPFRIKTKGKKMPLIIAIMGMGFNLVNGFFFGYFLGNFHVYDQNWLTTPNFIFGFFIFIFGMGVNWHSDNILIGLRKENDIGYKIPFGGLFRFVSCPNLLGEIIEWLGFAILSWSLPGLAFFVWTFANLVPRAIAHHNWYLQKFPDYPKHRKAIFPGIL